MKVASKKARSAKKKVPNRRGGAPAGNMNAVKEGYYAGCFLDEGERELFAQLKIDDVDDLIRFTNIRIRRFHLAESRGHEVMAEGEAKTKKQLPRYTDQIETKTGGQFGNETKVRKVAADWTRRINSAQKQLKALYEIRGLLLNNGQLPGARTDDAISKLVAAFGGYAGKLVAEAKEAGVDISRNKGKGLS